MKHIARIMVAVMMTLLSSAAFAYSSDNGLIGYWKMDDQGVKPGEFYKEEIHNGDPDYWGNSVLTQQGGNGGSVLSVKGMSGNAFQQTFYKSIIPERFPIEEFDRTKEMTISLWVKTPSTLPTDNDYRIIGVGPSVRAATSIDYNLVCDGKNGLAWKYKVWSSHAQTGGYEYNQTTTTTLVPKESLQTDTWYHTTFTVKLGGTVMAQGGKENMYTVYTITLNGEEVLSSKEVMWHTSLPSIFYGEDPYMMAIGAGVAWGGAANSNFKGCIDDVKVYNNGGLSKYELQGIANRYKILNSVPADGEGGVSINTNIITFETDKSVSADFFANSLKLDGINIPDVTGEDRSFSLTFDPMFDYFTEYKLEAPVIGSSDDFGIIMSFTTEKPPVYVTKNGVSIEPGTGNKSAEFSYESSESNNTALILTHTLNGRVLSVDIDDSVLNEGNGHKSAAISIDSLHPDSEINVFNWRLDKLQPLTYALTSTADTDDEITLKSRPYDSAIECDVIPSGDRIKFEGKISQGGKQVIIAILKPDENVINENSLYAIKQVKADEDGSFTAELGMNINGQSGYFPYIVSGENVSNPIQNNIYYASKQTIQDVITEINRAADYTQVKTILDVNSNLDILYSMGVEKKELALIKSNDDEQIKESSITRIAKKLFNDGADYDLENYSSMIETINEAISLEKVLHIPFDDKNDYIKTLLKDSGLNFSACGFEKLDNNELKWFFDKLLSDAETALMSADDLKKFTACMSSVALLNYADWRDISSYVKTYREYIEDAAEKKITASVTEALCKDFAATAIKNKFQSASAVVDYINKYVSDVTPPVKVSSGGSGGSKRTNISVGTGLIATGNKNVENDIQGLIDINDVDWASQSIQTLFDKSIVSGDSNGRFNPKNNITRAEFVKMIVTAFSLKNGEANLEFNDVSDDAWYSKYVKIAASNKIAVGADGRFNPDDYITREDVAVIVARAMKYISLKPQTADKEDFADIDQAHEYSRESIRYLRLCGIVDGYNNNYSPLDRCSRAEMACLIANVLQYME